jgi:hypothetical protein
MRCGGDLLATKRDRRKTISLRGNSDEIFNEAMLEIAID